MMEIRAVDRGHLAVFCTLCTWYLGFTTYHGLDIAIVIEKVMAHLDSGHGIDELRQPKS